MSGTPVILFDGLCALCSRSARFVLEHDRRGRFQLAAMQSEVGAALCQRFGVDAIDPATMLLIEDGRALRMSDAVFGICRGLGWPWRALGLFRVVPRPLRDAVYRLVARNRYRLFGRRETCWVPDDRWKDRML
jgi:predicted DCC family thiol-disulfide oxidoreductase YuxK